MVNNRNEFENLLVKQKQDRQTLINRDRKEADREKMVRNVGGENELIEKEFNELVMSEKEKLKIFFGYEIEVPPFPEEITMERYLEWKKNGFDLHYLPREKMDAERNLPGWSKKPTNLFRYIQEGKVVSSAIELPGEWVLIDERAKPNFDDGNQMYEDDPLAEVIEDLRERGILHDFKIKDSRFAISSVDFEKDEFKKAVGDFLKVNPDNIRLPHAIEWNFLGNIHCPEWGDTDTWECFDDTYADDSRLHGGCKSRCGLSDVNFLSSSDDRRPPGGFRLIVSFSE